MKLSLPVATLETRTWVTIAEFVGLGLLLGIAPEITVRLAVGLPLLGHLAWTAATSLPTGRIPGPPEGMAERRQNYHLRSWVKRFLKEVQWAEGVVQDAKQKGLPRSRIKQNLRAAEKRLLATATEVCRALGRTED